MPNHDCHYLCFCHFIILIASQILDYFLEDPPNGNDLIETVEELKLRDRGEKMASAADQGGAPPRNASRRNAKAGGAGGGRGRKNPPGATTTSASGQASQRQRLYSECTEDHCDICRNRIRIFAVGICNHPVCGECSTRMRVLCEQTECPICRQDLQKVIFMEARNNLDDSLERIRAKSGPF